MSGLPSSIGAGVVLRCGVATIVVLATCHDHRTRCRNLAGVRITPALKWQRLDLNCFDTRRLSSSLCCIKEGPLPVPSKQHQSNTVTLGDPCPATTTCTKLGPDTSFIISFHPPRPIHHVRNFPSFETYTQTHTHWSQNIETKCAWERS